MARNAKLDLAKRQAVGIFRKASPNAFINHGVALYSGGDYRAPEGAKSCYQDKAKPTVVAGHEVVQCEAGKWVNFNHKRSRATPQERSHMNTFAYKTKAPLYAEPKWVPAGIQTLIPRGDVR